MANTKEIKNRINSIKETQKITNAMYLIASTKMQKAKRGLDQSRPYFHAVQTEIKRVFQADMNVKSSYFCDVDHRHGRTKGVDGILVISADKGLAGAYNQNVIRESLELLEQHENAKLYVVGEYGRQFFLNHGYPIEKSFLYTAQNPTMERAREISSHLLELYDNEELNEIYVVYTNFKNELEEEVLSERVLPFHRSHFTDGDTDAVPAGKFEFYPSAGEVLDSMIFSYVTGFIYGALVDSFCSEQNARMTAMSSANDNAEKLLDALSVKYNQVRQAMITQEITEISAGALSQRNKSAKEVSG